VFLHVFTGLLGFVVLQCFVVKIRICVSNCLRAPPRFGTTRRFLACRSWKPRDATRAFGLPTTPRVTVRYYN